jgi:O-antigen/teichoic acid export membrane protein
MAGFYFLSALTSFFNFLYYPVMARITPPHIYGEIQFLITIIFQVMVVFMALNVVTIILSVRYNKNKPLLRKSVAALSSLFNNLTVALTILAVIILIIFRHSLHFDSPIAFIALGIAIISTVPFTIAVGKLQGQDRFIAAGVLSVGGSVLKLLVSTSLVLFGFGATGAVVGIGIGQLLAVVIAISFGSFSYRELFNFRLKDTRLLSNDKTVIIVAGCSIVITNLIITADTIGAKLILSSVDAGMYAGIATLAKIAIYVVSPLMWMVISSAVEPHKNSKKITLIILLSSLMCLSLLAAYALLPQLIITLLIGTQYIKASHLLVLATTAMGALAVATLLNTILAASGKYKPTLQHAGLILACFVGCVILLGTKIEYILLSQLIAGGCGIAYYVGYKLIHQREVS